MDPSIDWPVGFLRFWKKHHKCGSSFGEECRIPYIKVGNMTGKMKNISEPKPKEVVIGEKKKKKKKHISKPEGGQVLVNQCCIS